MRVAVRLAVLSLVALFWGGFPSSAAEPAPLVPAAAEAARKVEVPLEGLQLSTPGSGIQYSDTLVFLAGVEEKGQSRQWLILVKANELKPEEKEKYKSPAMSFYVSTGGHIEFPASEMTGLALHVLGPFSAAKGAKKAKDIWSGAIVSPQFLTLGLDNAAALFHRLSASKAHGSFNLSNNPIPEPELAAGRELAAELHITPDEERSAAALLPALMNFFTVASQTPGIKDILFEMIDIPWLKLASNGGQLRNFSFNLPGPFLRLEPSAYQLPETYPVLGFPLTLMLEGKPALNCRLTVTRPTPPLANTGGIIAVEASRVDGKGPVFTLSLLAARPAPAKP